MGVKSQIHRQTQKATVHILLIRVLFLLLRNIKKGEKREKDRRKERDRGL